METFRTSDTLEVESAPRAGLDRVAVAIATGAGAGFVPAAPGTAGSLVGILLYLLVAWTGMERFYLPLVAVLLALGTWAAGRVERFYGHDASRIVIDEVVGQMLALGFVARAGLPALLLGAIPGFLIFRFFDILKPFPLRRLEKLQGGFGVMGDDVGAGMYTLLSLLVLEPLLSRLL